MNNFKYMHPLTLSEASEFAGKDLRESLFYAGGTDAIGLLKDDILKPEKLINLKKIIGLDRIEYKKGKGLKIGSMVHIASLIDHPDIKSRYRVISEAASEIASPQLRNLGTVGGNICQRPRCWYYRENFDCLRKGGATCYAYNGENKYHCVTGGDPCFIVHPSDLAVAFLALNARIRIYNGKTEKSLPIDKFFVTPEEDVMHENILKNNEIVTAIEIDDTASDTFSTYIKIKERNSWDFAIVSIAAVVRKNKKTLENGRFAWGGVAPFPYYDDKINGMLNGIELNKDTIERVANKVFKTGAEPLEQNGYKIKLAQNLVKKVLLLLA